jgi:hypothetical protein
MVHDVNNPEVKELDDGLSPKKEDVIQIYFIFEKSQLLLEISKVRNLSAPHKWGILKLKENYAFMTHYLEKYNQRVELCYG